MRRLAGHAGQHAGAAGREWQSTGAAVRAKWGRASKAVVAGCVGHAATPTPLLRQPASAPSQRHERASVLSMSRPSSRLLVLLERLQLRVNIFGVHLGHCRRDVAPAGSDCAEHAYAAIGLVKKIAVQQARSICRAATPLSPHLCVETASKSAVAAGRRPHSGAAAPDSAGAGKCGTGGNRTHCMPQHAHSHQRPWRSHAL